MNIKNREQFLMILTAVVFALLLGDWMIFEPLTKVWTARQKAIVDLHQQVSSGRFMIRREDSIRSHWQQMQSNALPGAASSAELRMSQAFDRWSQASGVNIENITPQWQDDETNYSTLDCRVDATGNLQTLAQFLYQVESDSMAVQIESVELMARDDQGQELSLGLELSGLALVSNPQ
ncbi:MAG TPA: GspMb/PilO family protein [Verrucomicrobiae bacterium]|jgi:Tfp pilus assembly protein PilO